MDKVEQNSMVRKTQGRQRGIKLVDCCSLNGCFFIIARTHTH